MYLNEYKNLSNFQKIKFVFNFKKKPLFNEVFLPRTEFIKGYNSGVDQHGRYEHVPEKYKSKPVLSVARDPLIRNISFYEYGWWKKNTVAPLNIVKKYFPSFPDLEFNEYLDYQNFNTQFRDTGVVIGDNVGNQTIHFIQFFFKKTKYIFENLNDEFIYSGKYRNYLPELTLLKSENLNKELLEFLSVYWPDKDKLSFINSRDIVRPENTSRKSEIERMKYLTSDIINAVRYKERYLYKILSDFGIEYGE